MQYLFEGLCCDTAARVPSAMSSFWPAVFAHQGQVCHAACTDASWAVSNRVCHAVSTAGETFINPCHCAPDAFPSNWIALFIYQGFCVPYHSLLAKSKGCALCEVEDAGKPTIESIIPFRFFPKRHDPCYNRLTALRHVLAKGSFICCCICLQWAWRAHGSAAHNELILINV